MASMIKPCNILNIYKECFKKGFRRRQGCSLSDLYSVIHSLVALTKARSPLVTSQDLGITRRE